MIAKPQSHPRKPRSSNPPPNGRLLTIRQAAPLLGYAVQSIYNSLWTGTGPLAKIPHYRMGRSIRFAEADLLTFREAHRVDPEDPGR